MAIDHEANQSIARDPEKPSEEPGIDSSLTNTPSTDTASDKIDDPATKVLEKNDANPELQKLEEAEQTDPNLDSSLTEIQVALGTSFTAVVNDVGKGDANISAKEEHAAESSASKKKFITLKHYHGEIFIFPWVSCQSWKARYHLSFLHVWLLTCYRAWKT